MTRGVGPHSKETHRQRRYFLMMLFRKVIGQLEVKLRAELSLSLDVRREYQHGITALHQLYEILSQDEKRYDIAVGELLYAPTAPALELQKALFRDDDVVMLSQFFQQPLRLTKAMFTKVGTKLPMVLELLHLGSHPVEIALPKQPQQWYSVQFPGLESISA